MIIKNVTDGDLIRALHEVNKIYKGNIKFRQVDYKGLTRQKTHKFSVRLTVIDSHGPGAKINPINGRHIATACWHVVGNFFDALPEHAVIWTMGVKRSAWASWEDRREGSMAYPFMSSQACECEDGSRIVMQNRLQEVK